MMTSCVVFVMLVFLPCSSYVGRYHIMAIIILGAALLLVNFIILKFSVVFVDCIVVVASQSLGQHDVLLLVSSKFLHYNASLIHISPINKPIHQVATLVSITLAIFGLDASSLKADRVISKLQSPSLLTGFLRLTLPSSQVPQPTFKSVGEPDKFSSILLFVTTLPKNDAQYILFVAGSARPALASGQACLGLSLCWAR